MSRIDEQLIIEGRVHILAKAKLVIGLKILFAGIGQRAVADIDAGSAKSEEAHARPVQPAQGRRDADLIVISAPQLACGDQAGGNLPIDIGVIDRLIASVAHAGAEEEAEILCDLLLNVDSAAHLYRSLTYAVDDWGKLAREIRIADDVIHFAQIAIIPVSEKFDGAGLAKELVASFKLCYAHKLAKEHRLDVEAIGNCRKLEDASARRPPILLPLDREAMGIAP